MSHLTARGRAQLQELSIRVLCDFRTLHERERETVQWAGNEVMRMEWDYDSRRIRLTGLRSAPEFSADSARSAMLDLYRMLPAHFEEQYEALFAKLAAGDLPLVFGCSAGKDRTGVAAALVLTCLGVPWHQVVADFALTDQVVDLERELFQSSSSGLGLAEDQHYLLDLSPQARAPLLKAAPEYLEAAFDQIRRDHGSVDMYLRSRLHISDAGVAKIRAHLLEDRVGARACSI